MASVWRLSAAHVEAQVAGRFLLAKPTRLKYLMHLGHVSRAMVLGYSHVRMEAKRRALDEIGMRQAAADEKRKAETLREQEAAVPQLAVIQ